MTNIRQVQSSNRDVTQTKTDDILL